MMADCAFRRYGGSDERHDVEHLDAVGAPTGYPPAAPRRVRRWGRSSRPPVGPPLVGFVVQRIAAGPGRSDHPGVDLGDRDSAGYCRARTLCVPKTLNPDHSGDEVRPGWRLNE